ncbi:formin [Sorangium sp. So ce204]|uniref:formin n=2 Tax=unclassified Sorangium TaxID=2621164 RepID=UPI003F601577
MAEEKKKSKIDLKARLGKTAIGGAPGAAVPLPMPGPQPGSGPPPDMNAGPIGVPSPHPSARPPMPSVGGIAPPPGISPGIPLPPFAPAPRPVIQTPPPKPTAAAQTIKVEVGEEVEQERRKASKKTALYAGLAAIVGIGVGFAVGGAKERGDRGKLAVDGAAALAKDVKAANEKMKELNEKLGAAAEALSRKSFPAQLPTELGAINVPFDATNLENKQIGGLPGRVMRQVLAFTTSVQDLNKTKDSLKNLLSAAQAPVEKSWKEQDEPVVNFSVVFRRDGDKTLAELVPNKAPFPFGKDWPAKYTVSRLERTQQGVKPADKEATRWTKGDIAGGDLQVLPVDPQTVAAFTSEQIVFKLRGAMIDIRQLLEGKKDNPADETPGLIKEADDLANELHKLSLAR